MSWTAPSNKSQSSAAVARRNATTAAWAAQQEDSQLNSLNKKPFSANYRAILDTSRRLPIASQRQAFLDMYQKNKVMIIVSETGSGKSTQIPKFVLYDELVGNGRIAITQPRRLATISVAARVAEELDIKLGDTVGYAVSLDSAESKNTRLRFCTDGLLLAEAQGNPTFRGYSCIIIDEVHERSLQTDVLLMMLKSAIKGRDGLRVILMSATVQAAKFQEYFGGDVPVLAVTGRQYRVDDNYLQPRLSEGTQASIPMPTAPGGTQAPKRLPASPNFVIYAVKTALHIHATKDTGDILIFMPGEPEIHQARGLLMARSQSMEIIPLYGAMSKGQQDLIYQGSDLRRCIISTNIAETSLTIPNIVYIIDTGLVKEMLWNPRARMHELKRTTISKFSANQRKGRAGRVADGECFRLYSEETLLEDFQDATVPAILANRLESVILSLLCAGHRDLLALDFIDSPDWENVAGSMQELLDLRLVHEKDQTDDTGNVTALTYSPTTEGKMAAGFPIEPIMFRLLEASVRFECLEEMTVIVAAAQLPYPIWQRPLEFDDAADRIGRSQFANPWSDHITALNAIQAFVHVMKQGNIDVDLWCRENFLSHVALTRAIGMRQRLCDLAVKKWPGKLNVHADTVRDPQYTDRIRKALAVGLATQSAVLQKDSDSHITVNHNQPGIISPESVVLYKGYKVWKNTFTRRGSAFPAYEWIVYNDFTSSGGKSVFNTVTVIEPEWFCNEPFLSRERATKKFNGQDKQPHIQARLEAARKAVAEMNSVASTLGEATP